ncbi:kielin/chordin-like protein [Brienomyrus brachyistius]|uniref:kielin/chordin-like protein n=1 Tax=Brienomyrus brachyistius TaxID=42636 RepID=UPI0020B2F758|nr:kielin/chordin-like protein [Brienomyrus brachyistius]
MEEPPSSAAVCPPVFLTVLCIFNFLAQTEQQIPHQYFDKEDAVDLLEAVGVTHPIRGIVQVKGMEGGLPAWRFHKNVQHLTLPQHESIDFQRKVTDSFGLYFAVQQKRQSSGTLISFTMPAFMSYNGQPLLQLFSSRRSNLLQLYYMTALSMEPASIHFPISTAFSKGQWARIALSLNRNRVVLFVNCEEAKVLEKDFEDIFSSMLLNDLEITLASTPGINNSKFQGSLQTAWLSSTGYSTRPWHCPNTSDLDGILWPKEDSPLPPENVSHRQVPSRHLEPQSYLSHDQKPDLSLDLPQSVNSQTFPQRKVICLWEGKDIEEGTWTQKGPDEVCLCYAGEVRCMPSGNGCVYEGTSYKNGDVFLSRSSLCTNCSCIDGLVKCIPVTCMFPFCLNPKSTSGSCCLPCSGCMMDGVMREEGSVWMVDQQPCRSCMCLRGEARCHEVMCPQTSCQEDCRGDDECTNACCFNGRRYKNEETFSDPSDHCKVCVCQTGEVICRAVPCTDVTCSNPYTPRGECCPRCSECFFENAVYLDGQLFSNPRDPCQECTCLGGEVTCESHCNHPQPASYCQDNRNDCYYAGEQYLNGMEFVHPTNKCKTCRCVNGHVQCLMTTRPPSQCSDPHLVPGECHPRCSDECLYVGRIYRHSEHFRDPQDRRRSCFCSNGEVTCQDNKQLAPQNRCYPEVITATGPDLKGDEGELCVQTDDQRKLEPPRSYCPEHQDLGDCQPRCKPQPVHQCPHTTQNPCPQHSPNPNPCVQHQPCETQNPCEQQEPSTTPQPCVQHQPCKTQNPCPQQEPSTTPRPCVQHQPCETQNPCPQHSPNSEPCMENQPYETQNLCPQHSPNSNRCVQHQPCETQNPCQQQQPSTTSQPCVQHQPCKTQNPCPQQEPSTTPRPCVQHQPCETQNPCPQHSPNSEPCMENQPYETQNPCQQHRHCPGSSEQHQLSTTQSPCSRPIDYNPCPSTAPVNSKPAAPNPLLRRYKNHRTRHTSLRLRKARNPAAANPFQPIPTAKT